MANNIQEAARKFVETWSGRGYEKGESQTFWYQLLHDVYGIEIPANFITFEKPVALKNVKFIDGYIPSTKVIIEQKSSTEDLQKAIPQSDKESLTPFEQAQRYSMGLKYSDRPRWIVTCNFKSFLIYDMEKPQDKPFEVLLENLEREYYLLRFLTDDVETTLRHEQTISIKAGELIGRLYDELLDKYVTPHNSETKRSLNILCVRLVFCLFAEDSGLFGSNHGMFHDYLASYKPSQMRDALVKLFKVLNTPVSERSPYENEQLLAFPYVNGGLFADDTIEVPSFNESISHLLLTECSAAFDWSGISPTIFGALFEDTMNPDTREEGCMHYTSVENIHRVIDPLFLDSLKEELKNIMQITVESNRKKALLAFQDKLASLNFFDPACGSGNFLTETYISLRKLENEVLQLLYKQEHCATNPIKISIKQFYGIEINDFAVTVAQAALWIAEAQMMRSTECVVKNDLEFFPLRSYSHIVEGNALRVDWNDIAPSEIITYIIGNPPFKGKKSRDKKQKEDILFAVGKNISRPGNLDLVTGWFFKAAQYIQGTKIQVSFVSTVNITRGEQVSLLWDALLNKFSCKINYAFLPFVWNSESKKKAQVHCVIICFSVVDSAPKYIYNTEDLPRKVEKISPYIREEDSILVASAPSPICDVPTPSIGNKPIDDGNFLFRPEEKENFLQNEPGAAKYFVEWYGSDELVKGKKRYFLWLANCPPNELKKMPLCKQRIENVRMSRSASSDAGTRKLADFPTRFHVTNIPTTDFIVIPEVTSENRKYIPMVFVTKDEAKGRLYSNLVKLMPEANLFHFGILQSIVHMVWTKAVCGYKDYRPRYSTDIVFNNFPWINPTEKEINNISKTAQAIIDARSKWPDCSLADLYDEDAMPDNLRLAHQANDRAVLKAYGFDVNASDQEIINKLLLMYKEIISKR